MSNSEREPQFQLYYALHGGEPVQIAACSFDDLETAREAASQTDDSTASSGKIAPSTRHFYEKLGEVSGLAKPAEAALDHYDAIVTVSRDALLQQLRNGNSSAEIDE